MLAYAAQGLEKHQTGPHQDEVRKHLTAMDEALNHVAAQATESRGWYPTVRLPRRTETKQESAKKTQFYCPA